jgi:hypothetical protein
MKLFLVAILGKFWKYVLFNEKNISTKKSSLLKKKILEKETMNLRGK